MTDQNVPEGEPDDNHRVIAEFRSLSHDLRSSLTGIMGLAALIERSDDLATSRAWASRVLVACRTMEGRIGSINEIAANSSAPPTLGR